MVDKDIKRYSTHQGKAIKTTISYHMSTKRVKIKKENTM